MSSLALQPSRNVPIGRLIAGALLLALASTALAADEPSDKEPNDFLDIRASETAQPLHEEARKVYKAARAEIDKYLEAQQNGKLKSLKLLPLGQTYIRVQQVGRLGTKLSLLGEPAGYDFSQRQLVMQKQINDLMNAYRMLPGVDQQIAKGFAVLKKESDRRQKKSLPLIDKLMQEEKWQEADDEALDALDTLGAMGVYYTPDSRPYRELEARHALLDGEHIRPMLEAVGLKEAVDASQAQLPDYPEILKQLTDATTAIGMAGKADLGGNSLDGPAAVKHFGDIWRQAHLAAVHCQALDWAQQAVKLNSVDTKPVVQGYEQFNKGMIAGLAGLIDADARRATADEADALYPRYLAELAANLALSSEPLTIDAIKLSLDNLAAKSPSLSADVAAYRVATADLLAWRSRAAQAQAKARQATFPELDARFWKDAGMDGGQYGLMIRTGSFKFAPALQLSVPDVIARVQPVMNGQGVSLTGVLGPRADGTQPISSVFGATYAQLHGADSHAAAVSELEDDLLVATGREPLSLEAALALESARRGDCQTAGGQITGVAIEGLVPRFAKLTEADRGLARLGPLTPIVSETELGRRVIFRFDVAAAWIQNPYFFVELAPVAPLTQAAVDR